MVRLVASDLDGTLLRSDGTISERTRAVLRQARAAGVVVVLVTGRPPLTLRMAAEAAGVSGLAICSNGAVLYDLDRASIVRHTALEAETTARLVQAMLAAVPEVCFGFVRGEGFACDPAYYQLSLARDRSDGYLKMAIQAEALALCDQAPTKLIVRHARIGPDDLLAHVQALGFDGFEATHSGAPWVEIAAAGVTKAWALEALCGELGIGAHEVVAFGDAPNDLQLLRWAGHSVAVANAHPHLLAEAHEVAPANNEDGVAVVLERLLAGR
ncbi:MAG: HAD family phosphatase [Chloroflexi bacterium]|nr:HAD family phosphatase [Chloroflexota bacterium]